MTAFSSPVRSAFALAATLLLLWAGVAAAQQPTPAPPASVDLDALVAKLEAEVGQIRLLSERLQRATGESRDALLYRRDLRSLEVVRLLDRITPLVLSLPAEDPARVNLEQRIRGDLADVGRTVYERLKELEERIDQLVLKVEEASGVDRVEREANLESLEQLRFRYYEALIGLSRHREEHGLPPLEVLRNLPQELFQYAEIQVGKVEFSTAAIAALRQRLKVRPDQQDLATALDELQLEQSRHIDDLRIAVELMDRLELDSAPYRTVILQKGDVVSISMFDSHVLAGMALDGWKNFKSTIVENAADGIFRFLLFVATLLLFFWFAQGLKRLMRKGLERSSLNISSLLKEILISVSGGVMLVMGLMMALSQLGISLGPMLAGLGVAGFIVGFALQDTLSNFASGAMILLYRPYDVDDFIEVSGASGVVKKMTLVSTTIATFDNQILVVPNNKIWGDVIKNVTAQRVRRVDLVFGVSYSDDIEKTEQVLQDVVASHDKILRSPEPVIKVHTLGDSSVNFIVRPWVRTEDYWDVYWDLTRAVKMRFDIEGISIPFPQRDVHFYAADNSQDQ
ncbi:mechanosensitive ion channel family protein [Parahaliea aestuarii]|uniref:Small-conductance mechanosensitive channel n=1 Tax=Parahaliea aestuarii TaxID=1852021 RepID=A0A5C8ZST8_9GAMM|nr:mechanosensitive ion channel family protein [Parahaliea aestuarii]TXS91526.1 mechanosensitive ion channel [Parahaliea aestuarii]